MEKAILNQPDKGNPSKLFSLVKYKSKLENRSAISTVKSQVAWNTSAEQKEESA